MKEKCYWCKHRGDVFLIKSPKMNHCHCHHPDEEVSGDPGWGTLRFIFNSCTYFEERLNKTSLQSNKDGL